MGSSSTFTAPGWRRNGEAMTLDEERRSEIAHTRERLLERYGLCVTERDIDLLAALCRRSGAGVPGAVDGYRRRWLDVPFRHVTVRCCFDDVTQAVRTVIPADEPPTKPAHQPRGRERPMAMRTG